MEVGCGGGSGGEHTGAQSECRAMESASQDWDFDQRARDRTSPIAR